MISKTISYTDFNGVERTEKFYFHLSEAELTELNVSYPGGLSSYINRISETDDQAEIVAIFKKIVSMSYGIKSDDGRRFQKSEEITRDFLETNAYSELFMELASNADAAIEFINGLVPADLAERSKKMMEKQSQEALPSVSE